MIFLYLCYFHRYTGTAEFETPKIKNDTSSNIREVEIDSG